jgi:FHS family L-fucose permease-like MFS transporter
MAIPNTQSSVTAQRPDSTSGSYGPALTVLTTLFFIWGSLTSLNDVLIPFAQNVFNLSLAESFLIQTAFFFAYFVFSFPSAKIIDWIGYKRAIIVGLSTMVAACLLVYPAAKIPSFPFFLTALLILAAGITVLQVAANPYVAVLGRPETASSRLNLTQAFNSLGTAVFPWIGAKLILGESVSAAAQSASQDAVVKLYVYFFAILLVLLAILFAVFRLPKMETAEHRIGEKVEDSVWKHPNLVFGAIGIFVYVGAEVSIGSSIANYLALDNIGHFASSITEPAARYHAAKAIAAQFIGLYWLGAMFGRFIGSAVLSGVKTMQVAVALLVAVAVLIAAYLTGTTDYSQVSGFLAGALALLHQLRPLVTLCTIVFAVLLVLALIRKGHIVIKTAHMLGLCAACAAALVLTSVFSEGHLAMWSILLIGFFNSIMFPSIFTSGIAELGRLTGDGSGVLNTAIVGGAVIPYVVGKVADLINHSRYPEMTQGELSWGQGIHYALIIAAVCYVYIVFYAVSGSRPNSERYGGAKPDQPISATAAEARS